MSEPFQITRRVEFGDTDMAGIMHFSNFFRFMEVAETEFLRSRGLNVAWAEAAGKFGFPRVAASCDYQSPARFGDLLTITVSVEKVGRKSVSYRFEFSIAERSVAVGAITAVYCRTGTGGIESFEIPAELRAKIEG
jgi:YbgC/YbaW family acyl-CoA thioester hydrolase